MDPTYRFPPTRGAVFCVTLTAFCITCVGFFAATWAGFLAAWLARCFSLAARIACSRAALRTSG